MTFDDILGKALEMLQRRGRVSYRALTLQFGLNDEYLEALKDEIINVLQLAVDQDGKMLVWAGNTVTALQPVAQPAQGVSATAMPLDQPARTPGSPPGAALDAAERRQLTVLFCDLVGSTALSTILDPEDLRELVRAYQAICATVIARFEGHIAQYLGDGLLVYFGYPMAHEDDPQRAVRAGLGIVEAIERVHLHFEQEQEGRVAVRVGIHTGLVVVGEVGSGGTREQLALGETPNVAARLQGLAEPNTVVISGATSRLVSGYFECQALGAQALKGMAQPLAVYQVLHESAARSRLDVATATGLTPLIGRDQDLEFLLRCWGEAHAGQGHVVLLCGEPGIGKSRLMRALEERVAQDPQAWLTVGLCSPYYQDTAFHPVIDLLERVVLQFGREEPPEHKLRKLEGWLVQYGFILPEVVPLFASLLSVPLGDRYASLALSPERQKQRTMDALMRLLHTIAAQQPVLFLMEDLHWADPSTLELLERLVQQVPTARVLALLSFRPDFSPPPAWTVHPYVSPLTLSRLAHDASRQIVRWVTGGKAIPAEVLEQVVTKTEGVPLFVEELTKTVLESDLLREADGRYELTGPLPPLAIPATLQDSLMARLDRLALVKGVAQLGATLGREFSYELLQAVSTLDGATLREALERLVEAELLYQQGQPPQATYTFKHALIQDVAYQTLLRSTRQRYHQQIAHVLEARFPDLREAQPELLARHYTEAGLGAQAIGYWQRAGEHALARSAHLEAVSHIKKGLEVCRALPDTPERIKQELTLLITLASALIPGSGYTAPEVEQTYARARALYPHVQDDPLFSRVPFAGLYIYYHGQGIYQTAIELAEQLLVLAQRQRDTTLTLDAHAALGLTLFTVAEFERAREHLEQDLAAHWLQQGSALSYPPTIGTEPGVSCLAFAGPGATQPLGPAPGLAMRAVGPGG